MTVTKDYFENQFDLYANLNLSIEQHEFMLVHRTHPKLPQLIQRLASQELKVSEMTLAELEKALTTSTPLTLFGGKNGPEAPDVSQQSHTLG